MPSKKKENKRYIKNLSNHINSIKDAKSYSVGRFDILVISLSSTALALTFGALTREKAPPIAAEISLIKMAWLLFVITIISNLLSQVTSYYAYDCDLKITQDDRREARGKPRKGDLTKLNCKFSILNHLTNWFNAASLISLIAAIILTSIFFSNNITQYHHE